MSPGTAYVLMHHSVGEEAEGKVSSWGMPEGGMGAVADACRIGGRVVRRRDSGELPGRARSPSRTVAPPASSWRTAKRSPADLVVTTCHPQITFLDQIERHHLPDDFVHDIENWRSRSGTVKINLALDRLPEFTADPGFDKDIHGGAIFMMDDLEYLETAFQEARAGKAATLPFSDMRDPDRVRPHPRPRGQAHHVDVHPVGPRVMEQGAPRRRAQGVRATGSTTASTRVAPGFKDSILHEQIIGPHEMERDFGLIGGNIFHGELTVDQLFHMRPAVGYADYRTPIKGLYQGSSATHAVAASRECPATTWCARSGATKPDARQPHRPRRQRVSGS